MHIIIAVIAIALVALPILTGIIRIIWVLFSGIFHLGGIIFLVVLAIAGIYTVFMTGPIGWGIAFVVFIIFKAVKS